MNNLSNTAFVKGVLLISVSTYILMLLFGLFYNASLKRYITVESQKQYGVVVIRNVKHPTPYRLEQARISYTITNPMEYLLLPSGMYQKNLLSAVLKLIIAVLFGTFVWRFDFNDPFQVAFLKRAYLIYRLFIGSVVLGFITSWYTSYWSGQFFYKTDYHAYSNTVNLQGFMLLIALLTVGIYLYTRAVKNKQELDLTI